MAELAAKQAGVISTAQLHGLGLNKGAIQVRVRRGQLHPLHRGVYAVGHPAISLNGRFWAAVLACGPGALLSHFAAAVLWGLLKWDDRPIEVTVVGSGGRGRPRLRIHRTRCLHPHDRDRQYGIPVTSPARTLLDLAGSGLSDKALRRAVRQAQALHLVSTHQIAAVLQRANGRRGAARLAALIAQRLILEVDSGWHDGRLALQDDDVRQADLEAIGERVLRTTREQAIRHPRQLVQRLAAAGAPYTDRR